MKYIDLTIHWRLLWADLARPFHILAVVLGFACGHPKSQLEDFGRKCGACGAQRLMGDGWLKRQLHDLHGGSA